MDKDIQIEGFPLIKFQSGDKIDSLQKGLLYAKTLDYYREIERETGNDKVGDEFEAMIHINNGYMCIGDGDEIELSDALIKTTYSNDFAFCMFGIDPSLQKFSFTDQQKEEMLSFGDFSLIILNSDEFIKRIYKAADIRGYTVYNHAVQYFDPTVDNIDFYLSLLENMQNVAMWKREKYAYQQEYRFLFTPKNSDDHRDHICLDIGDISDISTIVRSDKLLSKMEIRRS